MSNLVRKRFATRRTLGRRGFVLSTVRAADAGKRVYKAAAKNKGKVALGVAALGAAALMHKHRGAIGEHATAFRSVVLEPSSASTWLKTGGAKVIEHFAEHSGGAAGEKIGHDFGGEFGGTGRPYSR